jgi:hypothetical protein
MDVLINKEVLTDNQAIIAHKMQELYKPLYEFISSSIVNCREQSLALTNAQQSELWCNLAILKDKINVNT